VVIVGQDPYHQPNQGHGLSFSVPHTTAIPPSLRNIYKELLNDPDIAQFDSKPTHGNLERWADQGLLLLNNVLTVRRGEAGRHSKKGWEEFTDAVIRAVIERDDDEESIHNTNDKNNNKESGKGVVFLLWGKPASVKAQTVLARYSKRDSKNAIIMSSHESIGSHKSEQSILGKQVF
jgi:uracil-DNA glycosylase